MPTHILFEKATQKNSGSRPAMNRTWNRMPPLDGYSTGFCPYGPEGRGFYYVSNEYDQHKWDNQ